MGKFSISATADNTTVKAGEPVNVKVAISGVGNLKLLKQPVLTLPKDFDKYDPKITDKTKLTQNGVEGSMVYEYLIVPRNQGSYTIPPVEFVYYDTNANDYKTLKTAPIALSVQKGDGKSHVADFSAVKDNDIHDLKTGNDTLSNKDEYFFGSIGYMAWLMLPLIIFAVSVFVFRKRAMDNANIVRRKGKKANKVATKRLRQAAALMKKGKQNDFYDEVLRALWGYVGDKLNIPVENLSKDNIAEKLTMHNIDEATTNAFLEAIDECEYARFAPGDPKGKMDIVYDKAVKAITEIDEILNSRKNKNVAKGMMMLAVLLLASMTANAKVTKQMADAEYAKENYQSAIQMYNEVLAQGVSADLYYNLGNAYFRTGNITKSILAYERALKLAPGDEDIRFNLQFARSKTPDKITPQSEMFFVTWYKSLVNTTDSNSWAAVSIAFFIIALVMLSLYLFGPNAIAVRLGFYCGVLCILVFVTTTFLAWQQKSMSQNHDGAVITAPVVNVKNTPSASSANSMVLHEGTRVDITDRTMNGWYGVTLSDGREGWLHTNEVEEI